MFKTNKKQKKEILEVAYAVAILQPLTVIPQIVHIFNAHSAKDVSLLTWVLLIVFNAFNFIYCLVYKVKPLIINNAVWVVMEILVVAGILIYR